MQHSEGRLATKADVVAVHSGNPNSMLLMPWQFCSDAQRTDFCRPAKSAVGTYTGMGSCNNLMTGCRTGSSLLC